MCNKFEFNAKSKKKNVTLDSKYIYILIDFLC